jgi:hypothetical protein
MIGQRGNQLLALLPTSHRIERPDALKIPARRAEYSLAEGASPPVQAEPRQKRIDGFESPLGMELLATVDWLIEREHAEPTISGIRSGLRQWPAGQASAERKLRLFDDRLLKIALDRLVVKVWLRHFDLVDQSPLLVLRAIERIYLDIRIARFTY